MWRKLGSFRVRADWILRMNICAASRVAAVSTRRGSRQLPGPPHCSGNRANGCASRGVRFEDYFFQIYCRCPVWARCRRQHAPGPSHGHVVHRATAFRRGRYRSTASCPEHRRTEGCSGSSECPPRRSGLSRWKSISACLSPGLQARLPLQARLSQPSCLQARLGAAQLVLLAAWRRCRGRSSHRLPGCGRGSLGRPAAGT